MSWKNGALFDVLIGHRPMLVELSQGVVGCPCVAEDVVHDVFIKLVEFRDQDAVRQPLAYVTRMVRNASIDVLRRQSAEDADHVDEDDSLHVPSPTPSPEATLLARDTLRHVYDALEQLPPRNRTAFEMVRLHEETLQHTARALDVSPTQVHVMVRNAQRHCAVSLASTSRSEQPAARSSLPARPACATRAPRSRN